MDPAPGSMAALVPIVYEELRRLAHHYMRGERVGHMLQTTALVNEAYMRLVEVKRIEWRSRGHFFAMAATTMRRVLVDHARERARCPGMPSPRHRPSMSSRSTRRSIVSPTWTRSRHASWSCATSPG